MEGRRVVYFKCILFGLVIIFLFSNCRLAYRTLLGVDIKPDFMIRKEVVRKAKRYGVPTEQLYVMDIGVYADTILAIRDHSIASQEIADSSTLFKIKNQTKNDLQPVQVRFFDGNKDPIFKLVNCFVDPPIPMRWNVDGALDEFPPKPLEELKQEEDYDLSFFLPMLKDTKGNAISLNDLPEAEYYAVIFWNSFFIRPSKRLIRQIQRYNKKKGAGKTHFLFVNNHNAHLFNYVQENREEALKEVKQL
jgi:hypothetical protein